MRLAHEITRYQHEAVDSSLAPHAKEIEVYALGTQWFMRQFVHKP